MQLYVNTSSWPEACKGGQQMLTSSEVCVHWALHCYQHTNSQQQVTPVGVLCPEVPLGELLPLLQCDVRSWSGHSDTRPDLTPYLRLRGHKKPLDAEGTVEESGH